MESAQSAPGQLLRHELASVESKSPPSPTSAQGLALVWILTAVVSGIAVDRWSSALALDVRWRVPAWGTLAIAAIAVWWPLHRQGKHFTASLLVLPVAFGLGGAWHTLNWKAFDAA